MCESQKQIHKILSTNIHTTQYKVQYKVTITNDIKLYGNG